MDNTNLGVCPDSSKLPPDISPSKAFWICLRTTSKYLGISTRHTKKLKKRFHALCPGQQQLLTQTWVRIGHLHDYGVTTLSYELHEGQSTTKAATYQDVLNLLFEAVETDLDAAVQQWTATKGLLDRVTAANAIEGVLA